MMLWNVNTINDRKLARISEMVNLLEDDESQRVQKLTNTHSLNKIDIIVIIEMGKKCSKFIPYNMNGFKLFSQLRQNKKGGGIGMYIRNNLHAHLIFTVLTEDYEILQLEISKNDDKPRNVVAIYRPPSGKLEPFMQALESLFMRNKENIIILGDMNLNTNMNYGPLSINANEYKSLLDNFNCCIYNQAITRFNKVTQRHSTIDHVISQKARSDLITLTSDRITTENFSDHQLIVVKEFGRSRNNSSLNQFTVIQKVNKKKNILDVKTNFHSIPINIHPSRLCNSILEFIKDTTDSNTSNITLKFTDKDNSVPPWIDMNYINLCNQIYNLTELISKLQSHHKPVSRLKSKLENIIIEKENYTNWRSKSYYSDKVILNSKEAWKVLNELTGKSIKKEAIILNENGVRISDTKEIANIFQEHFLSIVGISKTCSNITFRDERNVNEFQFHDITPNEVKSIINALDTGKASGLDNISPFLWTQISEECSEHVSILINQMFDMSIYPPKLKETQVIPIHKKESKLSKLNYRPVSITNSLDKIVEKAIQHQIQEFLEIEKVLDPFQYGFKKGRSCEDAIAKVISESTKMVDNKKAVLLISLDLSKAFDSMNHQILLSKLDHYGIRGKANKLMEDFLTDRVQYVKVGDSFSYSGKLKEGVPQGTQKGPPLFSIYINDMRKLITFCRMYRFADDTVLVFEINENSVHEIETDLRTISQYYEDNLLQLNLNKSCAVVIGGGLDGSVMEVLEYHGITLNTSMKYLGIEIDSELKFCGFLTSIKTKLNQAVGVTSVLRHKLTTRPLMNFYFSHFNSHLLYGTFLLIRLNTKDIQQLQILQNRIIKMIYGLPLITSTHLLYTQYSKNVLPVMGIIFMSICTQVKKSMLDNDEALIQFQKLRSSRTQLLKVNESRSSIRRYDIEIIGASIYNSLPIEIREINHLKPFKVQLKKFLLSKAAVLVSPLQLSTRNQIL
jgi:hypothetical protein